MKRFSAALLIVVMVMTAGCGGDSEKDEQTEIYLETDNSKLMTSEQEEITSETIMQSSDIESEELSTQKREAPISELFTKFTEGYAWARMGNYVGIIDIYGNRVVVEEYSRERDPDVTGFYNGYSMIDKVVVDEFGTYIWNAGEENQYGEFIYFTDGMILFRKEVPGIEGATITFTLTDFLGTKIGEFVDFPMEMQNCIEYLGNDWFSVSSYFSDESYAINFRTNEIIPMEYAVGEVVIDFVEGNGKAIIHTQTNDGFFTVDFYCVLNQETFEFTPIMDEDGTSIDVWSNGFYLKNDAIYSVLDETKIPILIYPELSKTYGVMDGGDYTFVSIRGVDQDYFFTIIDRNGTALFEPIPYNRRENREYFDGYIICENRNNEIWIYDFSGNAIHSITSDFAAKKLSIYGWDYVGEGFLRITAGGEDSLYLVSEAVKYGNAIYDFQNYK